LVGGIGVTPDSCFLAVLRKGGVMIMGKVGGATTNDDGGFGRHFCFLTANDGRMTAK